MVPRLRKRGKIELMHGPRFIGSEIYRHSSYGGRRPLRVLRVSMVMDLSRTLGWLLGAQYLNGPRTKPAALLGFHTPEYVAALQAAETAQDVSDAVRARHGIGTQSNPVFAQMYRRPATSAGAALLAGETQRDGGVIYAPGCGTHHGMPERVLSQRSGSCDPVIAAQWIGAGGPYRHRRASP